MRACCSSVSEAQGLCLQDQDNEQEDMEGEYDEEGEEDEVEGAYEDEEEDGEGQEEEFDGLEDMPGQLDPDDIVFVSASSVLISRKPHSPAIDPPSCATSDLSRIASIAACAELSAVQVLYVLCLQTVRSMLNLSSPAVCFGNLDLLSHALS